MTTLFLATRNAHKMQEVQAILGPDFTCRSLRECPDAPEAVEDADSFAGNAMKKAQSLAAWLERHPPADVKTGTAGRVYVLADDSGLEVDALDGAPGIHSARFAALEQEAVGTAASASGNTPDKANNERLLRLLRDVPAEKRAARFRCVLALCPVGAPEEPPQLFEGTCEGRIAFEPRGRSGFGYDPLFVPRGYEQTFAELGEEVKNRLSHRAQALARLKEWLVGRAEADKAG